LEIIGDHGYSREQNGAKKLQASPQKKNAAAADSGRSGRQLGPNPLEQSFLGASATKWLKLSEAMRTRAAYDAMRRRGVSAKDAEAEIEYAFQQCFLEQLIRTDGRSLGRRQC
jgi:hypothetical protein